MSSEANKNNLTAELYKENFNKYKEELEKIVNIKEDDFLKLIEVIKSINQKKIHLSFFLFSQCKYWIFPYIQINNIISNNAFIFGSKILYIFNKFKENNNFSFDEKSFILWYFYLFFTFYNEEKRNKQIIINEFRYFLLETNKIVSILYESKKFLINNIINFLDVYLITLKNYVNSSGYFKISPKMQKIKKMIIFKNFFALLEKISIFSIKSNNYKDFELILNYLKKIINNSLLNDEINIIVIDSNNIIQSFINNLLKSLDIIEIEKHLPTYRKDLIIFYNHFLIFKYKTSNIFSNCIEMLRKSYGHLYNFIYNKNIMIKDIFINNFYSNLLNELLKKEKEKKKIKNEQYPLESSFLFDHKNSIISFIHEKIQLDKNIIFFSFQIGKDENNLNINNQEFTLILIKYKNKNISYDIFLKIYLAKVEGKEKFPIKYNLCISQPEHNVINVVNSEPDYFVIDNNNTYYAAIYINDKKLKIYLYHDIIKKNTTNNNLYKEFSFHPMKKEGKMKFIIGSDEINSFYKGKIGPIIMIKVPNKDNIINKVIDSLISNILLLKDKYKDFLIIKSDLSKNYNFNLKDYYEQKEFYDKYEINEKENEEKKELKGSFDCLLYLSPNSFNHLDNKIINENEESNISKSLPIIPNLCNKNGEYIIFDLNVSIIDFERSNKLFGMDNCLNYICLQIEYYNQFAQYYLLKSNKNKNIFSKIELEAVIKEIINGIKENILLMGYHNQSKYLYIHYKKIFLLLYNCLLNLNTIRPIISDFFEQLIILKDIFRGIILNIRHSSIDKSELNNDEYVLIQNDKQFDSKIIIDNKKNYNSFLHAIISYYIGIIEILLNINFYDISEKQNNIRLIRRLFDKLKNCQKLNEDNDSIKDNEDLININYFENIFYKLLNLISLLDRYFNKKDMIIIDKDEKETFIDLLKLNFKLLINILNDKNENKSNENENKSNELFHKIFRFVLSNNRFNYYIIYSYLDALYNSSINYILIIEESEINYLKNFLFELVNKNIEPDIKENIEILLISILYDFIFFNPTIKVSIKFNFIEEYLKKNSISKKLLSQIKIIIEKYLLNNLIKNNIKNSIINKLNNQELMEYTWNLFDFLIIVLKRIKFNSSKSTENDLINNIYEIISIFKVIEEEIKQKLNSNKFNQFLIIYLINLTKFLYFIVNDDELKFLYNDKFFLKIVDGLFNNCLETTLFHSNIYFIINDKNNTDNKEVKKLISQAFFELNEIHFEQIYLKYINEENNEKLSEEDLFFIDSFSKSIEKKFLQEFNQSNYNIKNTTNYSNQNTIFFLSDFLKLLLSEKKYFKKYEKNKELSTMINFYKEMKEIILNIDKNYKESNYNFDFFFTSYYFYKVFQFEQTIDYYLIQSQILKYEELVKQLKNLKSELFSMIIIILDDHLKLNQINKDFYFKKFQTNDSTLRNVLKIIQNSLFNKKNKGKDLIDIFNDINKDCLLIEDKNERNSLKINSHLIDNISKDIQEPLKKMYSFECCQNIDNNTNIIDKEKQEKEQNNKDINDQNEKNNNLLLINYTDTVATSDISLNNIINDLENENEKKDKEDEKKNNNIEYLPLLELPSDLLSKNIFDEINKELIINPKKELMNKIFGVYFEESFFNNKTFKKLKKYYLNIYENIFPESKLLNFPSKIKNYTNGIETPLFLKENNKFFITKTFPITHEYFYNYMIENNIKSESIILLKKNISLSLYDISNNEEEMKEFDCELVKLEKTYYGNIINSVKGGFFIFKEKIYNINDNANNFKEELQKKVFTISALDIVATDNSKLAKKEAKNVFLDEEIFPEEEIYNNKSLLIFYSDIEEIIERRFLYLWKGIEIFLKNGKSYIFNIATPDNYNNFIKHLKKIENVIFREKDFFIKTPYISDNWRNQKLGTYEYLLLINKYGSRSLNDSTQYYVFPWILKNFTDLIKINNKESELYEAFLKNKEELDEIEETPKNIDKEKLKYLNDFRKLKYPVSIQNALNIENKIAKFNDGEEKFSHHHGTHYSTSSYVFYYLMRLEPFTTLLIELQNYTQENPDRMMQDLKDTIKIINSGNDNRELIPEFFSKIEFFVNVNCVYFGRKKNRKIVDDLLKMFDNDDIYYNNLAIYVNFIIEHKKLLNSKTIAININSWIDNVFGVGQLPSSYKKREYGYNIFSRTCYEEETDLQYKLDRLFEKDYEKKKIKKKIANKINLILSFGQTPQQIFLEKHKGKNLIFTEKNSDVAEEIPQNYGHQDDYLGDDFILNFIMNEQKKEDNEYSIKLYGIFFEINSLIGKIFILNESSELLIINTNFYNHDEPSFYRIQDFGKYQLPNICFFDKLRINNNYYYVYNIKYSFSSFPIELNTNSNTPKPYLYSSQYIRNSKPKNDEDKKDEVEIKAFKFITCRHLDNSFKIHCIPNIKKPKELETYSYICEDFVMSCKAISSYSFILGLKNGKLIKALINESENEIENKPQKNKKKKENDNNENDKYKITFEHYIQGHKGSINMIEIDEKVGVVITSGDDNKVFIRKLYDFELLTCIKIKSKFIISFAKISPMNFLYIMCYNKQREQFIIFGYTLSGLKFAKSSYAYYTNFDFTQFGNIICLINENELGILSAYNLKSIKINEKDNDYEKYLQVKNCIKNGRWIQFDNFEKYYGVERNVISYLSANLAKNRFHFKTLKATNISYFH